MKEIFEVQATLNGWGFHYGRKDFQNLIDDVNAAQVNMFLDPVRRQTRRSPLGSIEGYDYNGHFMLLLKSSLDELYDFKYESYIKPLYLQLDAMEGNIIGCDLAYETVFKVTEIVNMFSENMDGLLIQYSIKHTL